MDILAWVLIGLAAGAITRLVVPGRDPMGWLGTMVIGLIGSTIGGFVGGTFTSSDRKLEPAGLLGAVIGALVVLLVYRVVTRRSA